MRFVNLIHAILLLLLPLAPFLAFADIKPMGQEYKVTLHQLGIDLETHDPVMILKQDKSERTLAILIGPFEATAIALEMEKTTVPRPLTHDLMKSIIEALQAKVDRVVIYGVKDDTYFAKVVLVGSAGTRFEVESRPSDAIALALRTNSPMYATDQVLESNPKEDESTPASGDMQSRAQELVNQGDKLAGAAFTNEHGAFDPFLDSRESSQRKALEKYNEAIELCPEMGAAYARRSTAHYFLGEYSTAQKDARTALRLGGLQERDLLLLDAPFQGEEAREVDRACMQLVGASSGFYEHFWRNLAQTYWYDADFQGYTSEFERLLAWQKAHKSEFTESTLSSLARGYEALGNSTRAEQIFLEIGEGDSLVRLYIHKQRWGDARAALKTYADQFEPDEITVFAAGIDELEGKLKKVSTLQMKAAERLATEGGYYAFYLGLLQLRDGKFQQGRKTLQLFCDMCDSNPKEWGVTMAWECQRARQLLQPN